MEQAYYANGTYQPNGRNPRGIPVTAAEWIEVVEEPDPVVGTDQTVDRFQERVGDIHYRRQSLRAMTQDEIDQRDADAADVAEDALWKSRYDLFNGGGGTDAQVRKAIAHFIKLNHGNQ